VVGGSGPSRGYLLELRTFPHRFRLSAGVAFAVLRGHPRAVPSGRTAPAGRWG